MLSLPVVWLVAVQSGCFSFRVPDNAWEVKMRQKGQSLTPRFFDIPDKNGRLIHAISVSASDSLPVVVLVHGSPGSAGDTFLDYFADTVLTKAAHLVAFDRPGFGYTQGFGKAEPSQAEQAAAVLAVLDRIAPRQKAVLVGHSLGGSVIARFAMDYPELTDGLILVAASIDPDLEEHPWWQSAIDPPPLKWLIPKSFWASNREIKFLEKELRDMLPGWECITCPVWVLHARNDRLVPVANVDFARRVLTNCSDLKVDILPDGDHFIAWNRYPVMRAAILEAVGSWQ